MTVSVSWDGLHPGKQRGVYTAFTKSVLKHCLKESDIPKASVAVLYCSRERIQELNRDFRQIDRATDVLSFPFLDGAPKAGYGEHLGDLAICLPYCADAVRKKSRGYPDEIALMLVHGFLHLVGHDHATAAESRRMNQRTKFLLAGIATPPLSEVLE